MAFLKHSQSQVVSRSGYSTESYAKELIEMEKASKLKSRDRYSSPQVLAHLDAELQDRQRQLQVRIIHLLARTHAPRTGAPKSHDFPTARMHYHTSLEQFS